MQKIKQVLKFREEVRHSKKKMENKGYHSVQRE